MNWQIKHFEIPSDVNPDFFQISFTNDHCCGPGGSGDRNLFIDWVTVPGKKFMASDGFQSTRCQNANQNPGALYCGGFLKLKSFKNLNNLTKSKKIKPSNYNGISFERISFDWANDLEGRNNRWASFQIALLKPRFKNIELDALKISIVRNRDNRGERIFMRMQESRCYPECIGGPLPRSAFRDNNSKERSVNYLISGAIDHQESRHWYDLPKDKKQFVAELIMGIPQMVTELKKGRNWKDRNGINKFEGWKPIFKKIDLRLPKSKYAKFSNNMPIKIIKSKNTYTGMTQMMSDLKSVRPQLLHGKPSIDVDWENYDYLKNKILPTDLFLAQAPISTALASKNLQEIFSDPVFNLK